MRQVCFDTNVVSLEQDFSDYNIDLYVFIDAWAVNTADIPTTIKSWKLNVAAQKQKIEAERIEDISKWHQHMKVNGQHPGFHGEVVRSIREPLTPFGSQPLQQGIPLEGWVSFVIRKTKNGLMDTATATLTATDSFGRKHSVTSRPPWHCKGDIFNPDMPF